MTTLYRKSRPSGSVEIRRLTCGKVDRFRGVELIRIHARPTTFSPLFLSEEEWQIGTHSETGVFEV